MKAIKYIAGFLIVLSLGFGQSYRLEIEFSDGAVESMDVGSIQQISFLDSSALGKVRLVQPYNGQTRVPVSPVLRWSLISGSRYDLQLAVDSNFTDLRINETALDTNRFTIGIPLEYGTRYFWRVRAVEMDKWSDVWHFTTFLPLPPGPVKSFCLRGQSATAIRVDYLLPDDADNVWAYWGTDGVSFADSAVLSNDNLLIEGLQLETLYYIHLCAASAGERGDFSELLCALPSNLTEEVLIVNGFDRATTGNSYDFVREHAPTIVGNGFGLASCTNEAYKDGLLLLEDFAVVDYILGEESTADETFGSNEQERIRDYLKQGGNLLVSGSELAWDLDEKGNSSDRTFCHKYLKIGYAADAPHGQAGSAYSAEPVEGGFMAGHATVNFDNGSHGSYNVKWPDVFATANGSTGFLAYTGLAVSSGYAGVCSEGLVPEGSAPAKVVALGFPFETIYPEDLRSSFMQRILAYFQQPFTAVNPDANSAVPLTYRLFQNYPNPFNPQTTIEYQLPEVQMVQLRIYNLRGNEVATLVNREQPTGVYRIVYDASDLPSGSYLYELRAGDFVAHRKLCLLK